MKAKLIALNRSMEGAYQVTLQTRDKIVLKWWDDDREYDLRVDMKRWRDRRSLDANAYCWVLIDKLAERLERDKIEVYREAIRGIGGVSDTYCCRNQAGADRLIEAWTMNGTHGWFGECEPSKIDGCVNVTLYYGSSVYDTAQMHRLIDHIVQDCKALGIESASPRDIAAMEAAWGGKA